MPDTSMFDASPCEGVSVGICVMLEDGAVVYAGPIKGAPDAAGKHILFHARDFERLRAHIDRHRH